MKVHRLVVLPDYQGVGIGMTILNWAGKYWSERNKTIGITSSILNLKKALMKNNSWFMKRQGRVSRVSSTGIMHNSKIKGSTSANRVTYTFEYKSRN